MKNTFEQLGFKVHFNRNASCAQLLTAIRKFHAALTPGLVIEEALRRVAKTVYLGNLGGVEAAVSLQWLDELDAVRGSIFPLSPTQGPS